MDPCQRPRPGHPRPGQVKSNSLVAASRKSAADFLPVLLSPRHFSQKSYYRGVRNKRRMILICAAFAAAVAVAVLLVWQAVPPPEPIYQGRPLSEWLADQFAGKNVGNAESAIKAAGPSAVPVLLRLLSAHDTPLKSEFFTLAGHVPFLKIQHVNPDVQNCYGELGFQLLDPSVELPVQELIRIYDQKYSRYSQSGAVHILSLAGPKAKGVIPSLLRNLTDTNELVRRSAIMALGAIDKDPNVVVPLMIKGLQDSDNMMRYNSAAVLADFGTNAKPAVAALTNLIKTERTLPKQMLVYGMEENESRAFRTLLRIDPDAAAKLLAEFRESDPNGRVTKMLELAQDPSQWR